jgi:hypothetical protein
VYFGRRRLLVRRADAGELLDGAAPRQHVQPLRIACLGNLQRHVDEYLDEGAGREARTRLGACVRERRDQRGDHDEARIRHQPRHFGRASDVLAPVSIAEAEIPVQPFAQRVAVELISSMPERVQLQLQQAGERGLAGARHARQPHDERARVRARKCAAAAGQWIGRRRIGRMIHFRADMPKIEGQFCFGSICRSLIFVLNRIARLKWGSKMVH